jgi:type VI secretion system secreted protein Hcp
MAVDMFLKLDGINGESKDEKHSKEIDVLAFSWGASQSSTAGHGGGVTAGKVNIQDLSVTKWVDVASPTLLLNICNGTTIKTAVITVRKAGGKAPLEYLKISFKEILVTSYSTGGSGGEDKLTENVSFAFDEVKVEYVEQTATGGAGAQAKMEWKIAKNTGG